MLGASAPHVATADGATIVRLETEAGTVQVAVADGAVIVTGLATTTAATTHEAIADPADTIVPVAEMLNRLTFGANG